MTQPLTHNCLNCLEPLYHDFKLHYLWQFKKELFPVMCSECQNHFDSLEATYQDKTDRCQKCSFPLSDEPDTDFVSRKYYDNGQLICYDCLRWMAIYPEELINHQSLYPYGETIQQWLNSYKTEGDILKGHIMAGSLQKIYKTYPNHHWVVLPSSKESLEHRQFHATGLLLDFAGIPYSCPFKYIGDGKKQALKDRQKRIEMPQPFEVIDQEINESSIIIFDDVYTTGTTLLHAKSALAVRYPDKNIQSITISR